MTNMDIFWGVGCFLCFFLCIFGNYGAFACTTVRWAKPPIRVKNSKKIKQPPISTKERILCYVPLAQACMVRKALYKKSTAFNVLAIISGVLMGFNLFNKFIWAINSYVMFFASIGMYIGLILYIIVYGVITADCARIYGFSWLTVILCFIAPQLACWYLNNNIPSKMRAIHKEETFHEHTGDTVIKSRNNQ